jgi:superfamily II DNA or RNA helicase
VSALDVEYYRLGQKEPETIPAYVIDGDDVLLPRQYGLKLISKLGLGIEYETSLGTPVNFGKPIALFDYQIPFVDQILSVAETEYDFMVQAATGKGKTVMALEVARRLRTTTLVVVDQTNLLTQWVDRAKQHLGLTDDDIGIVQGSQCDYVGKKLVIAMMQTLVSRRFPKEFTDWAGLVFFDEFHITGAPTFSRALMMFSASLRIGLSATPKRRDSLQKIINWNLGDVKAKLGERHSQSSVWYLENYSVYSWYANISKMTGRFIDEVANDGPRTAMIVEAVLWLYERGHDVLVVGDRIEQLQHITNMLVLSGLPETEVAVYAGYRYQWAYVKDSTPKSRPVGWTRDVPYTPVKFDFVKKRIPKKELEQIKKATVICATYGIFSKGVDIPRLSAGIDCTPRSQATQVHGRILRESAGKENPIWVTIRDVNSYRAEYQFLQRLQDYEKGNVEVFLWNMQKGIKRRDIQALKRSLHQSVKTLKNKKIVTSVDGNNTLLM